MNKNVIIAVVAVVLLWSGFATYYFINSSNNDLDGSWDNDWKNVTQNLNNESWVSSTNKKENSNSSSSNSESNKLQSKTSGDIQSYEWDLMMSFKNWDTNSVLYDLKWIKIKFAEDRLSQEISVNTGSVKTNIQWSEEMYATLNNVWIIINDYFVFIKWKINWKWSDWTEFDSTNPSSMNVSDETALNALNALKDWWFVWIDQSKQRKTMFENLAKTKYWSLVLEAISTQNPYWYLKKYNFFKDMSNELFNVWSYELFFEWNEWENWETVLSLKPEVCDTFWWLFQMQWWLEPSFDSESCKQSIEQFNMSTEWSIILKQEWDKESISYEWLFKFNVEYWNWKLLWLNFNMQWVWIIEFRNNMLNIDINPDMLRAMMNELTIKWKIDFSNKANWNFDLNYGWQFWTVKVSKIFKDWKIEKMEWNWKLNLMIAQLEFATSYNEWVFKLTFDFSIWSPFGWWTTNQLMWSVEIWGGNLKISIKESENSVYNLMIEKWWNWIYNIASSLKDTWRDIFEIKCKLWFNDWFLESMNLNWSTDMYKITWTLKDWNLEMRAYESTSWDDIFTVSWKLLKNETKLKGDIMWMSTFETDINWDINLSEWIVNIDWNIIANDNINNEKNVIEFKMDFRESGDNIIAIPSDFTEIDWSMFQYNFPIMPALSPYPWSAIPEF